MSLSHVAEDSALRNEDDATGYRTETAWLRPMPTEGELRAIFATADVCSRRRRRAGATRTTLRSAKRPRFCAHECAARDNPVRKPQHQAPGFANGKVLARFWSPKQQGG